MIHQNIARDLLATGATNLQDAYRIAWMAGIPRQHRKVQPKGNIDNLMRGTATLRARAAEKLKGLVGEVMPHHDAGKTVLQISRDTGYCENTIRKAIRSQGQEPHRAGPTGGVIKDLAPLLPKVKRLRAEGASWRDIGKQFGVDRERLKREFSAAYGAGI